MSLSEAQLHAALQHLHERISCIENKHTLEARAPTLQMRKAGHPVHSTFSAVPHRQQQTHTRPAHMSNEVIKDELQKFCKKHGITPYFAEMLVDYKTDDLTYADLEQIIISNLRRFQNGHLSATDILGLVNKAEYEEHMASKQAHRHGHGH
jgi:hypothetical protein